MILVFLRQVKASYKLSPAGKLAAIKAKQPKKPKKVVKKDLKKVLKKKPVVKKKKVSPYAKKLDHGTAFMRCCYGTKESGKMF